MKMKTVKETMVLAGILIAASVALAYAQECGPGCPACSGKAVGDLLPPETVLGTALYIPNGEEETAVYSIRYGLFPWIDAGIGYSVDENETIWSARVQALAQNPDGWRPGLVLGTGSVQTGGSDQSVYAQVVKTQEVVEGRFAISLAGGYATDLPDFRENWGLGTVSLTAYDRVSPFYMYDGVSSHAGLSLFATEWLTLTAYSLEMEELAISVGVQQSLGREEME